MVAGLGAAGVLSRYFLDRFFISLNFEYGTFTINMIGSFLMGLLYSAGTLQSAFSEPVRTALGVGLLGGFTTFSAFSLQGYQMIEGGQYLRAAINILGAPILGVVCLALGIFIGKTMSS